MTIEIEAVGPTIGAEIRGVDCSQPLDAETLAAVREAWLEHLVVFFPDQQLTPDQQVAFASQLGEVTEAHPVEPPIPEHDNVMSVIGPSANFWHTDVTYMARPPMGSLLYAIELPPVGGDTMFADMRFAYDTLAPALQRLCDDLVAWHYDPFYADTVAKGGGQQWEGEPLKRMLPVQHPVVRVHPETGRKALFVNPQFTVALDGFDGTQGKALLQLLYDHALRPEGLCRYRWHVGTLGVWDNRATMHYALDDYDGARRVMHRVTLAGDRPLGRT
jgi:taurine dioxygenase